jgi:alanyl-tRNA synthetase
VVEKFVALDRTAFYPEGGGQAFDTGHLDGIRVKAVYTVAGTIVHELETKPPFKEGAIIHGIIDWERRIALMRHHGATHVVNAAARKVLGAHTWQVGADKTAKRARLDISHYKRITPKEMHQIELESNRIVMENRPITVEWLERNEAERRYGFTIYQGGAVPGKELRICSIENWDVEACGGLYPSFSGEIGYIKLGGAGRIQDGVSRLTFSAGEPAIETIQYLERLLEESAAYVSVPKHDLPKTVKRFFEEWKEQKKQIDTLKRQLAEQRTPILLNSATRINDTAVIISEENLSPDEMIEVAKAILEKQERTIVVLASRKDRVALVGAVNKVDLQINAILNELAQIVGGRAGGRGQIAQGGGPDVGKFDEMLATAKTRLEEIVRELKDSTEL